MKYVSTRGGAPPTTFVDALLTGSPLDGGAYVPERVPTIDFKKILNSSYETLCVEILSVFCANGEEFTKETLREIAHEACKTFADDAIAPVKTLGRRGARGWVHACELHRGPTLSAEDASMQMAVRMMDRALKQRGKRGNVMCSTTGEEGGAFARVAAEMKNMDAWIVYPGDDGDVTEPQEREMTCHVEDHVHPVKVSECPDGMSDVDAVVIDVLNDEAFRLANGMVSANSANVARVLCFVPLFFHAYGQVRAKREEWGRPVVFSIPSSTFALEYAGHLARLMGLPITVVAACNANGAAHRAISLGELYKTDMVHTSSSALDVVVAENMWRSLYYATGSNPLILSELQDDFDEDGEVELPPKMTSELNAVFKSAVVSDELMYSTIQREERMGYLPCPQTAIAIAALELVEDIAEDVPCVALAVSHPSKFPTVIRRAVPQLSNGASHPTVDGMKGLFHRRRTCSLEELERSLRRDISAVTVLRSPAPVKIERVLLARDEYEKIYMTTVIKRKRWRGFDSPLFTIACAVAVAAWAAVTTPETNRQTGSARAAARAAAKARRAAAKASGEKARALARTQRQAARDAAKLAKIQAKSARESARPRVYARDRRAARPPNEHFAHQPHRNIYA